MERINRSRRDVIIRGASAAAASFVVPVWLAGCGEDANAAPRNDAWEARARELENKGAVLTAAAPGKWAGKEGTHVPGASFGKDGTVTITTPHPMSAEHWIMTQYIRNQDGVGIGLRDHAATESAATAVFPLPKGTTAIVAYSFCNLHDHWKADRASAG
jgi:superoxide reductase